MPEISVIVPVYKVEEYLPACIDSILAQTFTDFELILVDDGSPDNCGAICDEYAAKDARIVVIHQENAGLGGARNTALDIACGEFITFCDSDDYYDICWLATLIDAMKSNQADVAVGGFVRVDENKQFIGIHAVEQGVWQTQTPNDKVNYSVNLLFSNAHGWEVWTRMFRTELIRKHHLHFCNVFAEDLCFVLECALVANKVVSIPMNGYYYRVRCGSIMQSSKDRPKLDAMNEISLQFASRFNNTFSGNPQLKVLPILHFLIMHNQYSKIIGTEQYPYLKQQIKSIRRYKEWRSMTAQIFGCYQELVHYFGKMNARRILLLSNYCLHGNWKRFTIESAIAYKWFIKEK